jgi:hypothetical protein
MRIIEALKYGVYRTPLLQRLMAPSYPYKISPGQLSAILEFINATRDTDGAVVEIGVAQGDTSVFILEHLKTTGDPRKAYFFDTFEGFTRESVNHEVGARGKRKKDYDAFSYCDQSIFEKNLERLGYSNFQTVKGDASKYDWSRIAPIAVVLLDIDLYQPTIDVLRRIWPHVVDGGEIVVDDCLPDSAWDGSLAAYQEFREEIGHPFIRVGDKGGVLRKSESNADP